MRCRFGLIANCPEEQVKTALLILYICLILAIFDVILSSQHLRLGRMPLSLSNSEALGRTYAAARMMAGLDQATLATRAGLSAGTVSNVERGRDSRADTLKAIRRALNGEGVLVAFSRNNGLASVSISFATDDQEED